MRIKSGMEDAYAAFTLEQRASADEQAMLEFMETWSTMMECALDHGADDISEIASITLQAAAGSAGVTENNVVLDGGTNLLHSWAHGAGLEELLTYRPADGLLSGSLNASMDVWYASQELLDALPDLIETYPSIQAFAPDILEVLQARLNDGMSNSYPTMSM